MAKIQAVWALDIGQAALKALKLVPGESPETAIAEAFDFVEYPKILSQPDADPEELVREAMATFLERNDLKGCRVAIAVPGQAGLVKFIKLPPVEKKRIPDIVKFEARQQIPFALEEVIWDYQQIGGDDGGDDDFTMAEVGLFAMKRDQIHRAIQPFKTAGIEVDIVQMGPIALFNFANFDQLSAPPEPPAEEGEAKDKAKEKKKAAADEDKGSIVLIDIGADNTDLIITDGTRIWQRNVPIGGNHFTRALTKELKLTFAKAEHLKRNATKAPDPRSVFTAMRGVFNDFSSEINRSIGFYQSVNRKAKVGKIVGLGNGFKLPGLQKFLQQNLSYDVEKLEAFHHLTGDEVLLAPQFVENLPSFAVAYGLGLQGLRQSKLRTNLLPPEIEQVRMIRRKKPWALAAAALLMLGFTMLFFTDWKAWAKVAGPGNAFTEPVKRAKSVADTGNKVINDYKTATGAWQTKLTEGESLFARVNERGGWPSLLKEINEALPNPALIRFDPDDPGKLVPPGVPGRPIDPYNPIEKQIEDQNRIHVDSIMPVWVTDLNTEWFAKLPYTPLNTMMAYDRDTPPEGDGWVVQIIGHHYNPPAPPKDTPQGLYELYLGPVEFLKRRLITRLGAVDYRMFGFSHPTVYWVHSDAEWTSDKGAGNNALATAVPLLPRSTAPAAGSGGSEGYGGYGAGMGGAPGIPGGGYGGGGMAGMTPGGMAGMEPGAAMGGGYGRGMPGMMSGGQFGKKSPDQMTYLTRTDFMVQFIWKPTATDAPTLTDEEIQEKMKDLTEKLVEAAKKKGALKPPTDAELLAASQQLQKAVAEAIAKKQNAGGAPAENAAGQPPPAGQPAPSPKP